MSLRAARTATVLFMVCFALAVSWPGMVPFNRIHPLVLGLPFSLFWLAAWIIGGCFVLWALDAVERRHREPEDTRPPPGHPEHPEHPERPGRPGRPGQPGRRESS